MENDGFVLVSVLIALCIFSLLLLAIGQEINLIGNIDSSSTTKAKALTVAVSTMEELKQEKTPTSGKEEKEGFIVRYHVEEFSTQIYEVYEIKVIVEDKNGKEILSLQTLREK